METDVPATKPRLTPEGKFALRMIAGEVILFSALIWLTDPEMAVAGGITSAMVATAMRTHWNYHRHVWFWSVGLLALALLCWLVSYFPWANKSYRGLWLPLGIIEYVFTWGALTIAHRFLERPEHSDE